MMFEDTSIDDYDYYENTGKFSIYYYIYRW